MSSFVETRCVLRETARLHLFATDSGACHTALTSPELASEIRLRDPFFGLTRFDVFVIDGALRLCPREAQWPGFRTSTLSSNFIPEKIPGTLRNK
jgi:hypothetical protein